MLVDIYSNIIALHCNKSDHRTVTKALFVLNNLKHFNTISLPLILLTLTQLLCGFYYLTNLQSKIYCMMHKSAKQLIGEQNELVF